jgi:hypothetical protein
MLFLNLTRQLLLISPHSHFHHLLAVIFIIIIFVCPLTLSFIYLLSLAIIGNLCSSFTASFGILPYFFATTVSFSTLSLAYLTHLLTFIFHFLFLIFLILITHNILSQVRCNWLVSHNIIFLVISTFYLTII